MATISINWDDLDMALTMNDPETSSYIDRETGEVIILFPEGVTDQGEEEREMVEEDPDRYIEIPVIPSYEAFGFMRDFIEQVQDTGARRLLSTAIEGSKPFRRFKDALEGFPEVREEWFKFEEAAQMEYVREWLAGEDIDAEIVPPDRRR